MAASDSELLPQAIVACDAPAALGRALDHFISDPSETLAKMQFQLTLKALSYLLKHPNQDWLSMADSTGHTLETLAPFHRAASAQAVVYELLNCTRTGSDDSSASSRVPTCLLSRLHTELKSAEAQAGSDDEEYEGCAADIVNLLAGLSGASSFAAALLAVSISASPTDTPNHLSSFAAWSQIARCLRIPGLALIGCTWLERLCVHTLSASADPLARMAITKLLIELNFPPRLSPPAVVSQVRVRVGTLLLKASAGLTCFSVFQCEKKILRYINICMVL